MHDGVRITPHRGGNWQAIVYYNQRVPPITVTRAELFEQVWARPMVKVAADYRVSATALVKACRKAEIPVPPQGYWNKLQFGKAVPKQPQLPPTANGLPQTVTIQPSEPPPDMDPVVSARAVAEQRPESRIVVPEHLHRPHAAVQDVNAALSKAPRDGVGMHSTGGVQGVLSVRVSPARKARALRILDAFIKALEARGYPVTENHVLIEGQKVTLGVEEKLDRSPHITTPKELTESRGLFGKKPPMWDHFPSGNLSLYTDAYVWWRKDLRKRWSDGRTSKLEDMLNDVLVDFVAIGAALRQRADEQRQEEERRVAEERRRQEQARQDRFEAARQKHLLASSDAWSQSTKLRNFIAEIEKRLVSGEAGNSEAMTAWVAWAKEVADRLDPLHKGLADYVDGHEKAAKQAAAQTEPPHRSIF